MQMDGPQCLGIQQSIDLCKSKGLLQQSGSSTLDLSVRNPIHTSKEFRIIM